MKGAVRWGNFSKGKGEGKGIEVSRETYMAACTGWEPTNILMTRQYHTRLRHLHIMDASPWL